MKKLLDKIKLVYDIFFYEDPKRKRLNIEITRVERALRRHQDQLDGMNMSWTEFGVCCPDCMYGGGYSKLQEKIERVQQQLNRLRKKRDRNK